MHTKMTKELDLAAMENCVCFNLRWVTRAVTQFFDAELRRHGIRPTQTPILAALRAKPGWSMEELSDWRGRSIQFLLVLHAQLPRVHGRV